MVDCKSEAQTSLLMAWLWCAQPRYPPEVDDGHLKTWDLRSNRLAFRKVDRPGAVETALVAEPAAEDLGRTRVGTHRPVVTLRGHVS